MTSIELAEITGKRHPDLMRDIRNEIYQLGREVGLSIFAQSSYINSQNKEQPCYAFGREGAMQLALKYDAVIRRKVILKLEELERISRPQTPTGESLLALAVIEAQRILMIKDEELAVLKPKALFADAVGSSEDTILIRDLAKLLKQNGIETGEVRLYAWLRENGYLIQRIGDDYNMPTQKSMELGLFRIKVSTVKRKESEMITKTTRVTGKGQQYFINKLCSSKQGGNK